MAIFVFMQKICINFLLRIFFRTFVNNIDPTSMATAYFDFKQFRIFHDHSTMKVGTDGVLLGSWASVDAAKNILDIGTGCGLIALMVAQRNPQSQVVGVELDAESSIQAEGNVQASPFSERIDIVQADVRDWQPEQTFDVVLSNPPFFEEDLLPPKATRAKARHTQAGGLTLEELVVNARRLMNGNSIFAVVLPYSVAQGFEKLCQQQGLFLRRKTEVVTTPGKSPKRSLLEFSSDEVEEYSFDQIILTDKLGQRSADYNELTKDFYLDKN